MPSKVTFQVVYSSSSDDNHSEKELEVSELLRRYSSNLYNESVRGI